MGKLVPLTLMIKPPVPDLQRLHVRSLPTLGSLDHVELHRLTFLQAFEAIRIDG
jgi:hypothetical protein